MDLNPARRQFLTLAGSGAVISLAGCPAGQGDTTNNSELEATPDSQATDETDTDTTNTTPADEGARIVALAVQPDQQQLRERQEQIRSELEAGNITRQQAQQQAQKVQENLRMQALTAVRERLRSETEVTITDAIDQVGALLLSGSASALLDTLAYPEVSSLLPEQTFQEAKAQVQEGAQSPTPAN